MRLRRGGERTGSFQSWMACALQVVFIFLLFLWLAVFAFSFCVVSMVRRRETGRATVLEAAVSTLSRKVAREARRTRKWQAGSASCSLTTVLSYIAFISAIKAWCCEALASYCVDTCGSCLGYSFSCLERLFSCTVSDEVMSVMNFFYVKSLLKQNGFHYDLPFLFYSVLVEAT